MSNIVKARTLDLLVSLKRPLQWAVAAGLLAAAYSLSMPDYFKSEARLLPIESKSSTGFGGIAGAAAAFGVSLPGGEGGDANFVDVLNSRWLREQLLNTEFQYRIRTWRFGIERVENKKLINYLGAQNVDRGIQGIGSVLSASRDSKTKVILISAETMSPELSQKVLQQSVKLLETFYREKGRTRGGAKVTFAAARLVEARGDLDGAEVTFRHFLEANRNFQTSGEPVVRLRGSRLEMELRLQQQLVTSIAINLEQAMLEEKNDIPMLNVLDAAYLPIDKSRPARSSFVLMAMLLVGVSAWAWLNWAWIRSQIIPGFDSSIPSEGTE